MPSEWLPTLAKAASSDGLLKEIYGDLAKPGVAQVGRALSTVVGLGNTILWPLQLLNERARLTLEANLETYRQKMARVSIDAVAPVSPEVGVPIAETLSYVSDPDLRELYINLLQRASIESKQHEAHPSFVHLISNLAPDEARLLKEIHDWINFPFVTWQRCHPSSGDWELIADLHATVGNDVVITYPNKIPAYIANLEGLGLVGVFRGEKVMPIDVYEPLESGFQAPPASPTAADLSEIRSHRGRIALTELGKLFLHACRVEA